MRLIQALDNEKQRQAPQNWNKVFLHKDGKFLHAYEWSAWLTKAFVCTEEMQRERGDKSFLSAFRYAAKGSEYAMIGFPLESLSKYFPEYADMQPLGDDLVITVNVPFDESNVGYDDLQQSFEEWKSQCPLKEKKPKQNQSSDYNGTGGRAGVFAILQRVVSYPVEQKSMQENTDFLISLKQDIVALL